MYELATKINFGKIGYLQNRIIRFFFKDMNGYFEIFIKQKKVHIYIKGSVNL